MPDAARRLCGPTRVLAANGLTKGLRLKRKDELKAGFMRKTGFEAGFKIMGLTVPARNCAWPLAFSGPRRANALKTNPRDIRTGMYMVTSSDCQSKTASLRPVG